MHCPLCRADDTKVVDSRLAEGGSVVRRRRRCEACSYRFTTFERADEAPLVVVKSDGSRQPFERSKVIAGIEAATKGRSVADGVIELIAADVEEAARAESARAEGDGVSSASIGLAVLERLRAVDEVAYLRFASVYKDFDAASDFHRELELLDKHRSTG